MSTQLVDMDVVWTGALETAWAKSQQRLPDLDRATKTPWPEVLTYLEAQTFAVTITDIMRGVAYDRRAVTGALYALLHQGRVIRSHRQLDDPRRAVRWSVKR